MHRGTVIVRIMCYLCVTDLQVLSLKHSQAVINILCKQ